MLGGTVLVRVSLINGLMNEKMTFSEHLEVMIAKAFAMARIYQETFVGI
jgi:hypothetical protein